MPPFVLSCSNNVYVRLISLYILQFDSYMKFEIVYASFLHATYSLLKSKSYTFLMLSALDCMLRKHFLFQFSHNYKQHMFLKVTRSNAQTIYLV